MTVGLTSRDSHDELSTIQGGEFTNTRLKRFYKKTFLLRRVNVSRKVKYYSYNKNKLGVFVTVIL